MQTPYSSRIFSVVLSGPGSVESSSAVNGSMNNSSEMISSAECTENLSPERKISTPRVCQEKEERSYPGRRQFPAPRAIRNSNDRQPSARERTAFIEI